MKALALLLPAVIAQIAQTPKHPVVNTYFGTKVIDNYRWLENWNDPKVQAWSEAQNDLARKYLDALPDRDSIQKRLQEIAQEGSNTYFNIRNNHGHLYAMKFDPAKEQPFVVEIDSYRGSVKDHTVVDPNVFDPKGGTSIDWFAPSPNGEFVAVSLSEGGSENGTVRVFRAKDGSELAGDSIPRVNGGTAGGSLCWNADSSGFLYTRYPGSERPERERYYFQRVFFHKLGSPLDEDRYEIGNAFPQIAEIQLKSSPDGKYVLATVDDGDGGDPGFWLRAPSGAWRKLIGFQQGVGQAEFSDDGYLYLLNRKGASNGEIRRTPVRSANFRTAKLVLKEGKRAIESFVLSGPWLYTVDQLGGPNGLRRVDLMSRKATIIELPPISGILDTVPTGNGGALVNFGSYLRPPIWAECGTTGSGWRKVPLSEKSSADMSAYEVVRETARSKDGTLVPIFLVEKKGTRRSGRNPLLATGYGGYLLSETPQYVGDRKVFLERGGIFADVVLRGGREFGEKWHRGGNLTRKQNVFDDFYAATRRLIQARYTSRNKLVIEGGSNGGLLMGAEFTQHPNLCKAVISHVGIYDMTRHEITPNGHFNVTEFGTIRNKAQFQAMLRYSPYQHVRDGVRYPAILFMTGANDPRVDPMQSRKMTARLQAASPGSLVLLRTSATSGHGIGTALSGVIGEEVDSFSFLFQTARSE